MNGMNKFIKINYSLGFAAFIIAGLIMSFIFFMSAPKQTPIGQTARQSLEGKSWKLEEDAPPPAQNIPKPAPEVKPAQKTKKQRRQHAEKTISISTNTQTETKEVKTRLPAVITLEDVITAIDNDTARYVTDIHKARSDISVEISAISSWEDKIALKFEISNSKESRKDFFPGKAMLTQDSLFVKCADFLPLFVSPGKTKAGALVFDKPAKAQNLVFIITESGKPGNYLSLIIPYRF